MQTASIKKWFEFSSVTQLNSFGFWCIGWYGLQNNDGEAVSTKAQQQTQLMDATVSLFVSLSE